MTTDNRSPQLDGLDIFVGRWRMTASFEHDGTPPLAETTFEWLEGRGFLIQRWHVDHPDAPDGIAIIGSDPDGADYQQNYFDSRGIARVYDMSFDGKVWRLARTAPEFSQRYVGVFDDAGNTISGSWEMSKDGQTWDHDFDLTYTRVSR